MKPNIRLMNARIEKGLRQWELARDVGIHETEYSKIENQRRLPGKELRSRIAGRLGVMVIDIF